VTNEIRVRTFLNRELNHVLRENRNNNFSEIEKSQHLKNINALIELLKDEKSLSMQLTLAEYYRERGDFNSCTNLLKEINPEKEHEKLFKEKVFSQAKVGDWKVFNVLLATPKIEYKCDNCGDSLILFNLEKMKESPLEYKHFRCKSDDKLFNSPSKVRNPKPYYSLTFFQKLFHSAKLYQRFILNDKIICPDCKGREVENFNPEKEKCKKCRKGNYISVKWF